MSRYYILTERSGVAVIEATEVDQSDPFRIRFIANSGITSFDRHELLWWSPVESSPPEPFANFDRQHLPQPHGNFGARPPRRGAPRNADVCTRSTAAMWALANAVRPAVPCGWKTAMLELKVSFELPASTYKVAHRLRNPDTGAEALDFSDALFAAIEVVHRIALEDGMDWNRSTLTLQLDDQGRCGEIKMNYEYGTDFSPR